MKFRVKYYVEIEKEVEVPEELYKQSGKNWSQAVRRFLNSEAKENKQKIKIIDTY